MTARVFAFKTIEEADFSYLQRAALNAKRLGTEMRPEHKSKFNKLVKQMMLNRASSLNW